LDLAACLREAASAKAGERPANQKDAFLSGMNDGKLNPPIDPSRSED
jgi:hypothetical protein